MSRDDYAPMLTVLRERLADQVHWLRAQWAHLPLASQADMVSDAEVDWLLLGDSRWATLDSAAELPAVTEPPRLAQLGARFGLSAAERWALFACLAPELDPGLERLYAYAQDHPTQTFPTPALLLRLFGLPPEALRSFLPTGALRHWRLLRTEAAHGAQPLALRSLVLEDRVTGFLLGVDTPDERVAGVLRPVAPGEVAPSQAPLVPRVAGALAEGPVNLIGPANAGQRTLAEAACREAGVLLWAAPLDQLSKATDGAELIRLVAREIHLQGAALLVEAEPGADAPLLKELTAAVRLCLVASRERLAGRPFFVPAVSKAEQAGLWRIHLERSEAYDVPPDLVEALVEQFDLAPEAIAEVAGARDGALLWQLCRERGRKALDGLAQRLESRATWEDLVLPPDIERHLREVAHQCHHRFSVYESWGFGHRLSRGRGVSALFAGPSGCGKTTAAEVLAGELQMDLYRIDLAGMVSKYIGETEKNLRRVFDAAEQAGAILFFDEADALFGKRSEVKDAHDRYANIEIDYLLQRMEEYRGVTILATNLRDALDHAFLRRLRFVIDFPFPEGEERIRLWQRAFPPTAPTEGLDYRWLARLELAGGNISTIAVNAAFVAAADHSPIRMEHVIRAIRRELTKLDKPIRSADFGPYAGLVAP